MITHKVSNRKRENAMSYERVKEYFEQVGLPERVVVRDHIGDTVEHAAEAIGCEPARIAKTMSFRLQHEGGHPILIVMAGDARVDNRKYKELFHEKAAMIPGEQVEAAIGHAPGAVCPFAICDGVSVYLDVSLRRFSTTFAAGGSLNSTVELSPEELETYTAPAFVAWVDVCKDWNAGSEV